MRSPCPRWTGTAAAALLRRYGDVMTRLSLYAPYPMDPEVTAQITGDLRGDRGLPRLGS